MCNIYLIRHAKTKANQSGRICCKTQSPLIQTNTEIETLLKSKLETSLFDEKIKNNTVVVSSPSIRAIKTAETLTNQVNIEYKFDEFDFGDFENLTFDEIKQNFPNEYDELCKLWLKYRYPGGEDIDMFIERISQAFYKTIKTYKDYQNIIIVAHAGVIQALLSYLLAKNESLYWNFKIDNCSVVKLYFSEELPIIEYIK